MLPESWRKLTTFLIMAMFSVSENHRVLLRTILRGLQSDDSASNADGNAEEGVYNEHERSATIPKVMEQANLAVGQLSTIADDTDFQSHLRRFVGEQNQVTKENAYSLAEVSRKFIPPPPGRIAAVRHAARARAILSSPENIKFGVQLPTRSSRYQGTRSRPPLSRAADASDAAAAAPVIRAPSPITRVFTQRVCAALAGLVSASSLLLATFERWSLPDALYFTTTTLATIGFGDFRPATWVGRTITSVLGVSGVGLLGSLLSAVVGEWERSTAQDTEALSTEEARQRGRGAAAVRWWARREMGPGLFAGVELALLLLLVGMLGFKACEPSRSWLDAAYLVVGVMTTAGLGDVVPNKVASKLFLSAYAPCSVLLFARVLGSLALRPLERARAAAQGAVLRRYSEGLTVETLDEVARGPIVKRLGLSTDDSYCSRDEFTLLTLVLQGKVSEQDLAECRATFAQLDKTGNGRLSIFDIELARQARLLRVGNKLRRRQVRRLDKAVSQMLGPPLVSMMSRIEALFPQWKEARHDSEEEAG